MHFWRDGHFISISACEVYGVRVEIQISMREFQTHIHLNYIIVEFLFCIKKKMLEKVIMNNFIKMSLYLCYLLLFGNSHEVCGKKGAV